MSGHEMGPAEFYLLETQMVIPQQRMSLGIHLGPDGQERGNVGDRSGESIFPRRQKRFLHWYGQFICHRHRSK